MFRVQKLRKMPRTRRALHSLNAVFEDVIASENMDITSNASMMVVMFAAPSGAYFCATEQLLP